MKRYKGHILFAIAVALGWGFEQINAMVGWMTPRAAEAVVMVPLVVGAVFLYFWAVGHRNTESAPKE